MSKVKLVWITPESEKLVGYCARVSNPKNQDNPDVASLLAYCVKNKHWSIFEMAGMCIEISTSRAISAQILRHRSFSFQEFSQRYAEAQGFVTYPARRQDSKNRQNSIDDMDSLDKEKFQVIQGQVQGICESAYEEALRMGVAKEQARFLLPMSTKTRLYMNGSIRSWIHYLELRTAHGTQLEHKEIANEIKGIFVNELPVISEALGWCHE